MELKGGEGFDLHICTLSWWVKMVYVAKQFKLNSLGS
jgi:hypothetical protein